MITVHQSGVFPLQLQLQRFVRGTSTRKMTSSRSESRKVSLTFSARVWPHRVFLTFFFFFFSCLRPDEPLARHSSQVQAAEDILDKYRNIKRSSPSDGATGGTSYDGTGGEKMTLRDRILQRLERWSSFCVLGQIFAVRTASMTLPEKTLCRTSRPTISSTRPARRPGSTTPSFPSGLRPAVNTQTNCFDSDSLKTHSDTFSDTDFTVFASCLPSSDAKKKLRLALCSADSVALPIMAPATTRNGLPDHMDSEGTPS